MYTARIRRDTDASHLHDVFTAEDKEFPNGRAQYSTEVNDNTLTINIEATDTKALKAVTNSIITVLDTYDKSERI